MLAIVKDYVANVEVKVVRCCVASLISAPLTCYHGGLDCVESFRWLANQVGHTVTARVAWDSLMAVNKP